MVYITNDAVRNRMEQIKTEILEKNEDERGASMLEYALLAALIAVVCIVAVTQIGQEASTAFSKIGSSMASSNVGS